jgi:hypothetical protein
MRGWLNVVVLAILIAAPRTVCAQNGSHIHPADSGESEKARFSAHAPAPPAADPFLYLEEQLRPLRDRVVQDDRLRMASGFVGLGMVAFEARHRVSHPTVMVLGTEVLRVALNEPLTTMRQRVGYDVAVGVGHGRFVLAFRRTYP